MKKIEDIIKEKVKEYDGVVEGSFFKDTLGLEIREGHCITWKNCYIFEKNIDFSSIDFPFSFNGEENIYNRLHFFIVDNEIVFYKYGNKSSYFEAMKPMIQAKNGASIHDYCQAISTIDAIISRYGKSILKNEEKIKSLKKYIDILFETSGTMLDIDRLINTCVYR